MPGVCREAFDIATLAFRIQRIEREAGFATAADPAKNYKLMVRNIQINLLEIVDFDATKFDVRR